MHLFYCGHVDDLLLDGAGVEEPHDLAHGLGTHLHRVIVTIYLHIYYLHIDYLHIYLLSIYLLATQNR